MTTTSDRSGLRQARREFNHIGKATLLRFILGIVISLAVYLAAWFVAGTPDILVFRHGFIDLFASLSKLTSSISRYKLLYPILLFVMTPVLNFTPYYFCAKKLSIDVKQFFAKPRKTGDSAVVFGIVGTGFAFSVSFFLGILTVLLRNKIDFGAPNFMEWFNSPLSAVLMTVTVVIFGPVTEEFICRGVLLHAFKRYGNLFAVICSSLIWALLHGNLLQAAPVFCMGLVFGVMALKFQSILPSISVHIIYNLAVLMVDVAKQYLSQTGFYIVAFLFRMAVIALIIAAIVLFAVFNRQFRLPASEKRGIPHVRAFLTSWAVILVIVIYVVQIVRAVHIH